MNDESGDRDLQMLHGLHGLAQRRGDGLLPELARLCDPEDGTNAREREVMKCEIITLPGLHERSISSTYVRLPRASALILNFPVPKWQKNAIRHG